MPRVSERVQLLGQLDWMLRVISSHGDDDADKVDADLIADILATVTSTRYLNLREYIGKNRSMNEMLFTYSDRDFRQADRMNKPSFMRLLDLIKDDDLFKNRSRNKQTSVWIQLMVVLQRLGCDGNGAATGRIARNSGFSYGSVNKFRDRVFASLMKFRKFYVTWPDAAERVKISTRMATSNGLPGCVMICDGTPAILTQRPAVDGEVYWTRKSHYALNVQLYCDDTRLIRYYQVGWPGTVYDSNVIQSVALHGNQVHIVLRVNI